MFPVAQAMDSATAKALADLANPIISYIVYPLIALLFCVAIVVFIYGVLQIVIRGGDEEARTKGKNTMTYGVIGLFIMVAAWGIIYVISNTVKSIF